MAENTTKDLVDAKELNFTLDVNEVNVILAGLGELPAKVSINLIDKIRMQATAQLQKNELNA